MDVKKIQSHSVNEPIAKPLERSHMPDGFDISLDAYLNRPARGGGYADGEARIPKDFGPAQSMRGFEETYQNIIDYIVRITYKIWGITQHQIVNGKIVCEWMLFNELDLMMQIAAAR
jgi:hypothetical protein